MIIKPVMLDETGQTTNQKIDNLNTQITTALNSLATDINTALSDYSGAQEETLSGFAEDMNTTLSEYSEAQQTTLNGFATNINTTLTNLSNELVGVLVSLKSVNGKYGAVVLDSGDIVISKSVSESKTIAQVLAEMQAAISLTPLEFGVEQISGTEDEYILEIDQGTPSST